LARPGSVAPFLAGQCSSGRLVVLASSVGLRLAKRIASTYCRKAPSAWRKLPAVRDVQRPTEPTMMLVGRHSEETAVLRASCAFEETGAYKVGSLGAAVRR
jgi:hypothetical protein